MSTRHNLTLRTATAVGRLADLQRRAERIAETRSPVTKAALVELSTALEELQVANEALDAQCDELNALRRETENAVNTIDEFAQAVPVAAVWTDRVGVIQKANHVASQLLNLGKHHLVGKPLMLFITDRAPLFNALRNLCETDRLTAVDLDVTVRPRERRPRRMKLAGRRLEHQTECLWFFQGAQLTTEEDTTTGAQPTSALSER